jgi:hypothetical protein
MTRVASFCAFVSFLLPYSCAFVLESRLLSSASLSVSISKNTLGVKNSITLLDKKCLGLRPRRITLTHSSTCRVRSPCVSLSSSSGSGEDFIKSQRLDALDEAELFMQAGESYLPFGA